MNWSTGATKPLVFVRLNSGDRARSVLEAEEGSEEYMDEESESEQGIGILDGCVSIGENSVPVQLSGIYGCPHYPCPQYADSTVVLTLLLHSAVLI